MEKVKRVKKNNVNHSRHDEIIKTPVAEVMHDSYADYVKYILLHRALPDLRDGLKPVQRKIIYALYKLNLLANVPPKKSARTVGEVIAKYHPHGDTSVYASLVRMSQSWKMNFPLVEIQGNNGSIDGDNPAAMRYTEARLTQIATNHIVDDIRFQTKSDYVSNFDNSEQEPIYLATYLPLLLVNGQTGIASGYATEIPPHNLIEVMRGLILLIDSPTTQLSELLRIIKGPDFPTSGQYLKNSLLNEYYSVGKGKISLCCRFQIKYLGRKNLFTITSIPYGVQKGALIRQIELIRMKDYSKEIVDVRDESDDKTMKIVLELKKTCNIIEMVKHLCSKSHFQINYSFNMTVIHQNRPMQLGLLQLLKHHINHSCLVLKNKTVMLLERRLARQAVLKCLLIVIRNIKEVVKIIMQAANRKSAQEGLCKRFKFTDEHANQVLELKLYRLSAFDIEALHAEDDNLKQQISKARKILKTEQNLHQAVRKKYEEIITTYQKYCPRRTKINLKPIFDAPTLKKTASLGSSPTQFFLTITSFGNIFRSQKMLNHVRILKLNHRLKKREKIIVANQPVNHDKLCYLFFAGGSMIISNFNKLKSVNSWSRILDLFKIDLYNNNIVAAFSEACILQNPLQLVLTKRGQIKVIRASMLASLPRNILTKFINLKYSDVIKSSWLFGNADTDTKKFLFAATSNGKCILLDLGQIPITSVRSGTVSGIRLAPHDRIVFASIISAHNKNLFLLSDKKQFVNVRADQFLVQRPAAGRRFSVLKGSILAGIDNSVDCNSYQLKNPENTGILNGKQLTTLVQRIINRQGSKASIIEFDSFKIYSDPTSEK